MTECEEISGLMMDYLYEELAQAAAREVEVHLNACVRCKTELASLRATRKAVESMPLDDPPLALTAALLREATRRARPSWLKGWLSPFMQHPALAAVASLVVVAGIAGVLWTRGGVRPELGPELNRTATPQLKQDEATQREMPASSEERGSRAQAPERREPGESDEGLGRVGGERRKREREQEAKGEMGTAGAKIRARAAEKGPSLDARIPFEQVGGLEGGAVAPIAAPESTQGSGGYGARVAAQEDADAFAVPPPASPSQGEFSKKNTAMSQKVRAEEVTDTKGKDQPSVIVQNLHVQAQRAATSSQCVEARQIMARINRADAKYYQNNVQGDKVLAPCGERESQTETSGPRRAGERESKPATSTPRGSGDK